MLSTTLLHLVCSLSFRDTGQPEDPGLQALLQQGLWEGGA
jgi:hypothetical protein